MTILGIITIITGITFLLNAYVFYVRFMQRKENCSKQIVVLVINYKRKTYRSFDNPTPTYFFFPLYQFKTRKREYKIQSKLGRRIKPEKGEYIEILDVVIKILKIPGVLQRNYPGTTHDRVNECIGKIFNLKMEKLIV